MALNRRQLSAKSSGLRLRQTSRIRSAFFQSSVHDRRRSWALALLQSAFVLLATIGLATATAQPAEPYPSRPIDLYIGSAPSGSTDSLGRVLAGALEDIVGQPVIVHNAPGAGGAVMATQLGSLPPDGYSLGMTISHAYTGNPAVMPDVTPYVVTDFTHLASVSKGQCALVTSTATPYHDFDDLLSAARRGERPIFASQSPLSRIVADYVGRVTGAPFRVITVQGGGEIMQTVLGGHADFGFSGGPHVAYVEAGQMRVLASVEDERLLTSPEVPTLKELGFEIASCSTFVVSAPPRLPDDIKGVLASALESAITSPSMSTLISNLRYPEYYLGPADVTRALEQEASMLARVVDSLEGGPGTSASRELPSAFMPFVTAVLGAAGIVLLTIGRLRAGKVADGSTAFSRQSLLFVGLSATVMLLGGAAMLVFGYLPGAAVIVLGFMTLGRAGPRVTLGLAVVLPVALWLLFSKLLGFPLP